MPRITDRLSHFSYACSWRVHQRSPIRSLLGGLIFFVGACLAPAEEVVVEQLRATYEAQVQKRVTDFESNLSELQSNYAVALERLKGTLGSEGKLAQAALVLAELNALTEGSPLPDLPPAADGRHKRLRQTWDQSYKAKEKAKHEALLRLSNSYLQTLADHTQKLTRSGRIEAALAVEEERKRASRALQDFGPSGFRRGFLRGEVVDGDLASVSTGCRIEGAPSPELLLDGQRSTHAYAPLPCKIELEFPRLYIVDRIHLAFFGGDGRRYHYLLETSSNGKAWDTAADFRREPAKAGLQEIAFDPRDVKHIRLSAYPGGGPLSLQLNEIEVYSPKEKRDGD